MGEVLVEVALTAKVGHIGDARRVPRDDAGRVARGKRPVAKVVINIRC